LIVGWALLVLDFLIVAGLRAQTYVSVPGAALETASYLGIAWFGWLIPGIAIARYFLQRETVRKQTPRWREASQRWQTFHYCARDDVVYVPGEGHGVAPEHVALLYRPANPKPAIALKAREVQA
jgi:hypothetical protein